MSGRDTKVFEVCDPCGFESVYAWRQFDGEWPNGLGKKNDKWCTWEDHHNGTDLIAALFSKVMLKIKIVLR